MSKENDGGREFASQSCEKKNIEGGRSRAGLPRIIGAQTKATCAIEVRSVASFNTHHDDSEDNVDGNDDDWIPYQRPTSRCIPNLVECLLPTLRSTHGCTTKGGLGDVGVGEELDHIPNHEKRTRQRQLSPGTRPSHPCALRRQRYDQPKQPPASAVGRSSWTNVHIDLRAQRGRTNRISGSQGNEPRPLQVKAVCHLASLQLRYKRGNGRWRLQEIECEGVGRSRDYGIMATLSPRRVEPKLQIPRAMVQRQVPEGQGCWRCRDGSRCLAWRGVEDETVQIGDKESSLGTGTLWRPGDDDGCTQLIASACLHSSPPVSRRHRVPAGPIEFLAAPGLLAQSVNSWRVLSSRPTSVFTLTAVLHPPWCPRPQSWFSERARGGIMRI
ncbi:hypothetical protein PLEOSDRAFT_1100875 [Pleurotus ostreatus PC15]|uniref:Uncharacterized protein n=1 Tax=Pleurotus ostreatus (strain PC15) TaxID=1137138 RepID=A0A067P938_PLEO1|nr:hypothetical protein PLEOSDRAFT_1100875 [Pleurotus ostreatus PC15]